MKALSRAAVASVLAALSGCDFNGELRQCAEAERCLVDAPIPVPRFPHNGAGLGSPSAVVGSSYTPYLQWDTTNETNWSYRVQLHKCSPGSSLAECPFPTGVSDRVPNLNIGYHTPPESLEVGKRYWWRVRACNQDLPGVPCGAWSAPRYFDVGRPEALPNDFNGDSIGDLIVAGSRAVNAGMPEPLYLYYGGSGVSPAAGAGLIVDPQLGITADYKPVVAGAGDLNGDGYSDLAVGYRNASTGVVQPMPVDVFLGGSSGPIPNTLRRLPARDGDFGWTLGRAGDVNGDGLSDLAVCQPALGSVVLFFGSSTGPSEASSVVLSVPNGSPQTCAFAALADADSYGGGFDELAVASTGGVRIYLGQDGTEPWNGLDLAVPTGAVGFGASLAGGDFNADGHGDLVVGSTGGNAYLYLGGLGWHTGDFPAPIVFGVPPGPIAPAGDVDNDGYPDLVVGEAPSGSGNQLQLFRGQATGAPVPSAVLLGNYPNYGLTFAGLGDIDQDTYEDVAVGSTGGVMIFRGTPSSNDLGVNKYPLDPPTSSNGFGISVSGGYGY